MNTNQQNLGDFCNVLTPDTKIAVRDLVINEKPYSRGIESYRLKARKKSIANYGWYPMEKITVLPDKIVLDGNHRVQGCIDLGFLDLEIPATIIDPHNYLLEAGLFMVLNADNPTLGAIAWWRGKNEAGDIVANLIWKLNADPNSNFYKKIRIVDNKSYPFTMPIVCSILNVVVFNAIDFYKRSRGHHPRLTTNVTTVSYNTILQKTNKYIDFVESAFEKYDLRDNQVPYLNTFQRGIMRFYILLTRNNKLNRQDDIDRARRRASRVNLAVLKRDGATEMQIGNKLLARWNDRLHYQNRLYFDEDL